MQGKVEIAGVNTAKLKVLKNEETMELLRRAKEQGVNLLGTKDPTYETALRLGAALK